MVEAAILSLIGAVLGLVLGVMLGPGMVGLVTQTINDFYYVVNVRSVAVPPLTAGQGLVIGVGAALLAALSAGAGSDAHGTAQPGCAAPRWKARRAAGRSLALAGLGCC